MVRPYITYRITCGEEDHDDSDDDDGENKKTGRENGMVVGTSLNE